MRMRVLTGLFLGANLVMKLMIMNLQTSEINKDTAKIAISELDFNVSHFSRSRDSSENEIRTIISIV